MSTFSGVSAPERPYTISIHVSAHHALDIASWLLGVMVIMLPARLCPRLLAETVGLPVAVRAARLVSPASLLPQHATELYAAVPAEPLYSCSILDCWVDSKTSFTQSAKQGRL